MIHIPKHCDECTTAPVRDAMWVDPRFQRPAIKTPYWNKIQWDTTKPDWFNLKTNATPYQLYVLSTRLRPHISDNVDIVFNTYQHKKKMIYVIEFDDGDKIINLNDSDVLKYQRLVDNIIHDFPHHCTLFYLNQPWVFDVVINIQWLNTILPYMLKTVDARFDPRIHENQWMVNLSDLKDDEVNYFDMVEFLQSKVTTLLIDLYKQGTLVLNKTRDADFIQRYRLTPWLSPMKMNDTQLYQLLSYDGPGNATEWLLAQRIR